MLFLCSMKRLTLFVVLFGGLFASCTSEYDERLSQARELQQRYLVIEETNMFAPDESLMHELERIKSEIDFLAKVSGNEEHFFQELDFH